MQRGFRTINPRRVRKPNNLNAISRERRSVWNERTRTERGEKERRGWGRRKRRRRWRLPKSNVRNTMGAVARVKRHRRNTGARGRKEPGRIFGTARFAAREARDIGIRRNNRRILCSFRESRPKPPAIPYRPRDRIVTTTIPPTHFCSVVRPPRSRAQHLWHSHDTKSSTMARV